MSNVKRSLVAVFLLTVGQLSWAAPAWTAAANVTKIQTYPLGSGEVRVVVYISGSSHNCGTAPSVVYYDAPYIGVEHVKNALSVALTAKASGQQVKLRYDCAIAGGGYGWGAGIELTD